MRKKITRLLALAALLPVLALSGCSSANPLPEGLEEEAVSLVAQEIVAQLIDGEYQTVADRFRADMKEEYSITAQSVENMMSTVKDAGAYVSTEEILVLGGKSKGFDEEYAAVAVYCVHEEEDVVYELSLDLDMELLGLAASQK